MEEKIKASLVELRKNNLRQEIKNSTQELKEQLQKVELQMKKLEKETLSIADGSRLWSEVSVTRNSEELTDTNQKKLKHDHDVLEREISRLKDDVSSMRTAFLKLEFPSVKTAPQTTFEIAQRVRSAEVNQIKMEARIEKLERALLEEKQLTEDLRLELRLLTYGTSNSQYRWEIDRIADRVQDARDKRIKDIVSLIFLTEEQGYECQLRAYPNGDGTGSGKCISLFHRIRKGKNDNALLWPFEFNVTFKVIDQSNYKRSGETFPRKKDFKDSFKADPLANSFQQPNPYSDGNIASSKPELFPHEYLQYTPEHQSTIYREKGDETHFPVYVKNGFIIFQCILKK